MCIHCGQPKGRREVWCDRCTKAGRRTARERQIELMRHPVEPPMAVLVTVLRELNALDRAATG